MANNNQKPVLIAISVGLVGLSMTTALLLGSTQPEPPTAGQATTPVASPSALAAPSPTVPVASPPTEAATPEPTAVPPATNRMASDLEREQIWKALGRKHSLKPAAPGSAAPSESAAALLPEIDQEYVGTAIKEQLVPVALDCYSAALANQPTLAGRVEFVFTIIGDEEVGGVVETIELTDQTTLDDEFTRECLTESLMAVTFPPPAKGGRVEARYYLDFEPDE